MTLRSTDIIRRSVLVIAYYFPPMGMSGVQRTLKFVKYLPKYGWTPTVLTVEPKGYIARDESLLQDLEGANIRVERISAAGPGRVLSGKEIVRLPPEWTRKMLSRVSDTFFIPDNKIGWKRRAVERALALHQEAPFDLVFATAPPFTDFLAGAEIKRAIDRPLVFDYRDAWSDYPFKFYPTPLHRWRNIALERRALRASSHVITTNRAVKEIILKRYRFLSHHDVDIIPQGYDPEDFPTESELKEWAKGKPRGRRLRITYAGVFWEDRVPDHFLRALRDLFEEKPRLRGRIEAVFVGTFREENRKLVTKLGLQDTVTILEYMPHRECVRVLCESDVLWMIVGEGLSSPGKVYEYIGARKPILGCTPDGFVRATILEAGGKVVPPDDVAGIKSALEEYLDMFDRHQLRGPREEVVQRYNRATLTLNLVKIFESLLVV